MKKRRKISNILIDLTSLLDVVFIVLLVLVCLLQEYKDKENKIVADNAAQQSNLEAQQELYNSQLEGIENISDYVTLISINASFDAKGDVTTRQIQVMNSDKSYPEPDIPKLSGMSVDEGYSGLTKYLTDYISNNSDKTIVLSLNEGDEDILYRDETEIKKIMDNICAQYGETVKQRDMIGE